MGERAPFRYCARYGVEAGNILPATGAMTHPTYNFRSVRRPQSPAPKVSLQWRPSIVSSCENPRPSTHAMMPFSRAPLNLIIALFVAVLSIFWRSCRSFFPRCAMRSPERFDWTRRTIPTHPPIFQLVWLSSFSLSD